MSVPDHDPVTGAGEHRGEHDRDHRDGSRDRRGCARCPDDDRPPVHRSQPQIDQGLVLPEFTQRRPAEDEGHDGQYQTEADTGHEVHRIVQGRIRPPQRPRRQGRDQRQQAQPDDPTPTRELTQHDAVRQPDRGGGADGATAGTQGGDDRSSPLHQVPEHRLEIVVEWADLGEAYPQLDAQSGKLTSQRIHVERVDHHRHGRRWTSR